MGNIINHLAEVTSKEFIVEKKRDQYEAYIKQAIKLNSQYQSLNKFAAKQQWIGDLNKAHQENLANAASEDKKPWVSTAYKEMKKDIEKYRSLAKWSTLLKSWSLKAYEVIMGLRRLLTEQTFVYHVMDTGKKYMVQLTEDQFLELLKGNEMEARVGTETLNNMATEAQATAAKFGDIFKLSVYATQQNLKRALGNENLNFAKEEDSDIIRSAEKDVIYQELLTMGNNNKPILQTQKKDKNTGKRVDTGKPDHSRLYELYSQLLNVKEAQLIRKDIARGISMEDIRKKGYYVKFNEFVKEYANTSELARDNIAFYRTGDAILDKQTLIENKVGDAVVSVKTIAQAIKNIAGLAQLKKEKLKKKLIELFSYSGESAIEKQVQGAAAKFAEKHIRESFVSRSRT